MTLLYTYRTIVWKDFTPFQRLRKRNWEDCQIKYRISREMLILDKQRIIFSVSMSQVLTPTLCNSCNILIIRRYSLFIWNSNFYLGAQYFYLLNLATLIGAKAEKLTPHCQTCINQNSRQQKVLTLTEQILRVRGLGAKKTRTQENPWSWDIFWYQHSTTFLKEIREVQGLQSRSLGLPWT